MVAGITAETPAGQAGQAVQVRRLELLALRHREAAEAFDAAEVLLGGDVAGGNADDATVDQWLELMIDGRADLYLMQPDRARAVLEQVRPLLEARGGPARKTTFYRMWTLQRVLRNRLRADDEDLAALRASLEAAEHTGEDRDKDVGYSTDFLGWALWLRGDLSGAAEELTRALALADRIGESLLRDISLRTLCLTALRRHDVTAVRALLPQSFAAARAAGLGLDDHLAGSLAISCWLAWQDGHPDEVLRLAAEVESHDVVMLGFHDLSKWVYLFPVLAVRLRAGELAEAVAAARGIIDPSQQWLPDDLTAALAQAGAAWNEGDEAKATELLRQALDLARARGYF